ncbi:protoporphyrinogen oxidase [Fimbriimonas ginsengisoli]|uniref:Coproporphyrinogen III oxidase n=1 Tax=Fimbriimonas ginsengisoli Gsoil 348 TaxID=661478 RepID=A0A068NNH1_FIMGI|nr:protoporphyrinogen oxidase [Fimbriimonas ginsengisoli]AIE84310.1 protoporphyrinogen oxidase [Fimbriimonas ginsengisoli Gsoil 348]
MRIAIVGGGITGLAAAYDLERLTDAQIDLFEASDRLGGKLGTERLGDLIVEGGPDCFFAAKPGVFEFIQELGLEDQLIAPKQKEFAMLVGGKLHRVPAGLVRLAGPDPQAVEAATFLTERGKAEWHGRLARGYQGRPAPDEDESIRSFFTKRFGDEFTRLVAEPLLAGTHGGDAERLSMRALYPAYYQSPIAPPLERPTFLSFRSGMQSLVDALVNGLQRTQVHLNTGISAIDRPFRARMDTAAACQGFALRYRRSPIQGGTEAVEEFDCLLLAIPANHAASLAPGDLAQKLRQIPHRSSAIVTLAYRREEVGHPLDGTGFLVPPSEPGTISGATWSSEKWDGRAPGDQVLLRVFLREGHHSVEEAREAIEPLLSIQGEPLYSSIKTWPEALPQYEVGHLDRLAEIDALLAQYPRLFLAGTSFRGVGVPDCLRQGREIAKKIAETL